MVGIYATSKSIDRNDVTRIAKLDNCIKDVVAFRVQKLGTIVRVRLSIGTKPRRDRHAT